MSTFDFKPEQKQVQARKETGFQRQGPEKVPHGNPPLIDRSEALDADESVALSPDGQARNDSPEHKQPTLYQQCKQMP